MEKLPPANTCAVKMFAANARGINAGSKDMCTHRTGLRERSLVSLKAITKVLPGEEGGCLQRARGRVTRGGRNESHVVARQGMLTATRNWRHKEGILFFFS